jgi:hypothetical protein
MGRFVATVLGCQRLPTVWCHTRVGQANTSGLSGIGRADLDRPVDLTRLERQLLLEEIRRHAADRVIRSRAA